MYTRLMETDHKIHGRKFQNGSISDFCNAGSGQLELRWQEFGLYHQTYGT